MLLKRSSHHFFGNLQQSIVRSGQRMVQKIRECIADKVARSLGCLGILRFALSLRGAQHGLHVEGIAEDGSTVAEHFAGASILRVNWRPLVAKVTNLHGITSRGSVAEVKSLAKGEPLLLRSLLRFALSLALALALQCIRFI